VASYERFAIRLMTTMTDHSVILDSVGKSAYSIKE
jgi:hypothetical protein